MKGHPMNREEKIQLILKAASKHSKRAIDISGKGKSVLKLEKGEMVSDQKVEEMFARANTLSNYLDNDTGQKLVNKTQPRENEITQKKELVALQEEMQALKEKVEENTQEIARLKEENQALRNILANKLSKTVSTPEQKEAMKPDKIMGFTFHFRKVGTQSSRYTKLYATKRINGKQVWVYIGDGDPQAKIKEWLAKNESLVS